MEQIKLQDSELEQVSGGSLKAIGANAIVAYQRNMAKGDDIVKAAFFAGIEGLIKGLRD